MTSLRRRTAAVIATAEMLAGIVVSGCSTLDPTAGTSPASAGTTATKVSATPTPSATPVAEPALTMTSQHVLTALLPTTP